MILPVTNTLNRRKIISRIEFFYILIEKTNVKRNKWKTQWNPKQLRILYSNVNVRKKTLLHSFTFILFFFSRRNRSHSHALNVWKSVVTSCVSRNKMKMSNECIYRASPCTNLPTLKSFQEPFSLDPSEKRMKRRKRIDRVGIDGNIYRWAFANTEPYWQCAPAYGETFGEQQPGNLAEVNSFRDRRVDKHLSTVG